MSLPLLSAMIVTMLDRLTLRLRATLWVLIAMLAGGVAVWVFMSSQAAWRDHLSRSYVTGLALFDALATGAPLPDGVTVSSLSGEPPLPPGMRETRLTLTGGRPYMTRGPILRLRIQARDIQYPVAGITRLGGGSLATGLANVTRMLASFCTEPALFLQLGSGGWQHVDGAPVWGCAAAPPDRRLWAVVIVTAVALALLGRVAETSAAFSRFAEALHDHRVRTAAMPEGGPDELRQTAAALNAYVAQDRAALENRARVLSGVSHDLGTPATRLRLRTALIPDADLRARLEGDIDQMTSMIDGALTYTRAEIGAEPFRQLSLTALVQAVVADYADTGQPVTMSLPTSHPARAGTVFAGGRAALTGPPRILIRGQAMSLRRALSNLIDNALKYGRAAEVTVDADADDAWITVSDRGSVLTEDDLARLTGAFQRGENAGTAPGVGLGLAIVSTIAAQHGGRLDFARADSGLAARLTLCRRWA